MSWARFDGVVPKFRVSITVDTTASAAAGDVQALIPDTFSFFWNTVDASGNEIRVTAADGVTVLDYQLASFNRTNREGYVQIDNFAPDEATVNQVWLYFGMDGAPSDATPFVYSASKAGYIYLGAPGPTVVAMPERPGDQRPRNAISKSTGESRWIAFDFGSQLQRRASVADGYPQFEEIYSVSYDVQLAGVSQAAMVTASSPKIVNGSVVQVLVGGGTVDTDYTVICTVKTKIPPNLTGQTLQARVVLKIRNPSEA